MVKNQGATAVYTDGACKGNPGPGGWGWVIVAADGEAERSGSGGAGQTTNQRMELQAVIEVLHTIAGPVHIYSDSTYVVNCFNDKWYEGWIKKGWKNSQRKPVANRDLWEPLIQAYLERETEIQFSWVKGHAGNAMNDRADELAVAAAELEAELTERVDETDSAEPAWTAEHAIWVVGVTDPDKDQVTELFRAIDGIDPVTDLLVSGLRRGTELLAAERALQRDVKVAVVLPFEDPAARWAEEDRRRFETVRDHAGSEVILSADPASPSKAITRRNQWIVKTVVGAIVVGDEGLATEIEAAGGSAISVP